MLQAIKELGEEKLQLEKRKPEKIVEETLLTVVQDPNERGNYPYVFVVVLRKATDGFVYDHIQVGQTDKTKIPKYLYRRGSSQGPNRTPTSLITEIPKTFQGKLIGWFNKHDLDSPLFMDLKEAIDKDRGRILQDLQKEWQNIHPSLGRQESGVLTIAIQDNGGLQYPGDFTEFRNLLLKEILEKYGKISQSDHICSICGERKEKVFGGALSEVFKFYNLDKPGYIAGGFRREDAWKNFPLCLDCILKIEEGRKFIAEHLVFQMGGQQYWLIPKFLRGVPEARETITKFFQIIERPGDVLGYQRLAQISEDEKEILYEISQLQDVLTYSFFFFQAQKGTSIPREITLLIDDVLPSRLSQIFEAKESADRCDLLHNIKSKGGYENIRFRFDEFRRFAPSNKAFLEVIDRVFRGVPLDRDLMLSWIMSRVRQSFLGDKYLKPLILRGLSALLFFEELRLFKRLDQRAKGGELMTALGSSAEEFFSKFSAIFPGPTSKVLFLLGVLAQKLLNIQYRDRGSRPPFQNKLKGLKMKEEDFRGLLPKIQNKLEEYGKNYYRNLEALISDYFLQAGHGWGMSTDEMNFYFVLGMNLQDEVSKALGFEKEEIQEEGEL